MSEDISDTILELINTNPEMRPTAQQLLKVNKNKIERIRYVFHYLLFNLGEIQ